MDSRGDTWANNGTFNMHYDMVTKGLCVNFCTIEKKVLSGSISQLERPTYSSVTKKKKRKGKKKKRRKTVSEESIDSLSEYESDYEHIDEKSLEEEKPSKDNDEDLLKEIEKEIESIIDDTQSVNESEPEGDFKEISITLGKKKRRKRRKKGKKKKVDFKEEEDEALQNFAFRTEK
tara:strand:- start:357 stop:884 length:528 start_codon:yes stop_codon:yes gene_type:complete